MLHRLKQMLKQTKKSHLSSSTEYLSPAKLNLNFQVLYKREDGYHEIASLYQAIDLFDRLFFSLSARDELTCSGIQIPTDHSNLIVQALTLFRTVCTVPPLKIHIEKKIPTQAGLGGGSSNAATTLFAINELLNQPLSKKQLIELASQIGSDVSFFFSSGTALCTGRGEIFEDQVLSAPLKGYLAKPHFGLCTKTVYQSVKITQPHQRGEFFNDLEAAAFTVEPQLAKIKRTLLSMFKQVVMTGSGSAFFCLEGAPKPMEGVTFIPFRSINWYE